MKMEPYGFPWAAKGRGESHAATFSHLLEHALEVGAQVRGEAQRRREDLLVHVKRREGTRGDNDRLESIEHRFDRDRSIVAAELEERVVEVQKRVERPLLVPDPATEVTRAHHESTRRLRPQVIQTPDILVTFYQRSIRREGEAFECQAL